PLYFGRFDISAIQFTKQCERCGGSKCLYQTHDLSWLKTYALAWAITGQGLRITCPEIASRRRGPNDPSFWTNPLLMIFLRTNRRSRCIYGYVLDCVIHSPHELKIIKQPEVIIGVH